MSDEPQRVLFVSDRYEPNHHGGAEFIAKIEADAWVSQGGCAAVFTTHGDGAQAQWGEVNSSGVIMYRDVALPVSRDPFSSIQTFGRTLMNARAASALERCVRSFKPDVIHAHHISFISYGAVARVNIPKVLTFHDYHFECVRGGLYREGRGICEHRCAACRPYAAMVGPALRKFDRIIAISSFIETRLIDVGLGERCIRLPNSIPLMPEQESPTPSRKAGVRLLILGRIEENKAIADFVERFAARNPIGQHLTVAGSGSQAARVLSVASSSSHVEYVGLVDKRDVQMVMQEHDMVIVPSRWHEVLNTVIKEAHAAGRPVIATAVGGNADLIRHGVDGYLVPLVDGDVDWLSLFRTIDNLALDPDRLAAMGEEGMRAAAAFSVGDHMRDLSNIYSEVSGKHR